MLQAPVTVEELERGRLVPLQVDEDGRIYFEVPLVAAPPPPPPRAPAGPRTGGGGELERWVYVAVEVATCAAGALIGIGAFALWRALREARLR